MSESHTSNLTLQELPELRRKTEAISQLLRQQIVGHFETLRPFLGPERIFGRLAGGKTDVPGADLALEELQQKYRQFTRKPYDLPDDFSASWLTLVGNALELHPWAYVHLIQGKSITMSSPLRWLVNYRSNLEVAQVKRMITGKETARLDFLRQFVVNALVLQLLLVRTPGLAPLFADLRYELKTETPSDLGGLPVVTITSILGSFRPSDDLILPATAFSGVPEFIELVDLETLKAPKDLLKERIDEVLRSKEG
ncbi:MAG TPA: hypothetical protein VGL72_28835 [Bryobacteraceae bacterium]|jgi:hypothetical protein